MTMGNTQKHDFAYGWTTTKIWWEEIKAIKTIKSTDFSLKWFSFVWRRNHFHLKKKSVCFLKTHFHCFLCCLRCWRKGTCNVSVETCWCWALKLTSNLDNEGIRNLITVICVQVETDNIDEWTNGIVVILNIEYQFQLKKKRTED